MIQFSGSRALAISVGGATVRAGGDAWFFITADYAFGRGTIRPDGRKIHPSFLFEVKKPEESRGPWDYYKLLQTTKADKAFRPLAEWGMQFGQKLRIGQAKAGAVLHVRKAPPFT
jgi:hypothetical protein